MNLAPPQRSRTLQPFRFVGSVSLHPLASFIGEGDGLPGRDVVARWRDLRAVVVAWFGTCQDRRSGPLSRSVNFR